MQKNQSVILYDGYCNLCSRSIQFVIRKDKYKVFTYKPLQNAESDVNELLEISDEKLPRSVLLIKDGKVFSKSDAALRIARQLSFPWCLIYVLIVIPRFLRDPVYSFVAKNRFKWFGKRSHCYYP